MKKTKTLQSAVLSRLEKMFGDSMIAARMEEDDTRLTVLLTGLVPDTEIYGDLFFPPVAKEIGDFKLFACEFELMDASGLEAEPGLDLMCACAMMNAAIPLGGFGVTKNEDSDTLQDLVFRYPLPLTASCTEDQVYAACENTFFALAAVLENAAPDLIALAKGEITRDEFLEKL